MWLSNHTLLLHINRLFAISYIIYACFRRANACMTISTEIMFFFLLEFCERLKHVITDCVHVPAPLYYDIAIYYVLLSCTCSAGRAEQFISTSDADFRFS